MLQAWVSIQYAVDRLLYTLPQLPHLYKLYDNNISLIRESGVLSQS